jgi:hypothetical protein
MINVSNIDIGSEYVTLTVKMNKEDMEGYTNNDVIKEKNGKRIRKSNIGSYSTKDKQNINILI